MRMTRQVVMVVAVLIACAACNRHESITGAYGMGVVAGQVVMAAGTSASPAGVRVSVVGTGMSTLLGPDGRFRFAGVPDGAELRFLRDDGIDARVAVPSSSASLVVELNGNTAKPGRRRAAPSTPGVEIEGLIKTVDAASLTVTASHGGDVTVKLTDTTVIRHGETTIAAADLEPGDRVHVKVLVEGDVKTATLVLVQNQGTEDDGDGDDNGGTTATANGTVASVGAGSLVVSTVPKGDVTVQVDADTIIKKQGDRIGLADIKAGDEVNSLGTKVDEHTIKARQIEVRGNGKNKGKG